MFGRRITLFHLFGFAVRMDASWLLVAVLITWSLAVGVFPRMYEGLPQTTYWAMGLAGTIVLFLSIIVHEFSHSIVARRFGMPMKGITLFIFGGVAEMDDEPPNARAELLMALAGPASSVLLAGLFYLLYVLGEAGGWPVQINGVFEYMALVNLLLVVFNMIPAFPLDGGRVLRAFLWSRRKNLREATRTSSRAGSIFGLILIVLGLVSVITGNFIGGIWWFLIGIFLRNAATMSYQQVLLRQYLEGEPVSRFMKTDPVTVPRSISVHQLVEDYIYKHHYKMFPVVDGERLLGCVTTRQVKDMPKDEWDRQTVGSLTLECSPRNTISPDTDAMKALARMSGTGISRLLVARGETLLGVLTLKDMLQFLALKMELEDDEPD